MVKKVLIGLAVLAAIGFFLPDNATEAPAEAAPEQIPDIATLEVGFLPESANGQGYVIGFPGETVGGITPYGIGLGSSEPTAPWDVCSTTAVALAKFVDGVTYELVDGVTPVNTDGEVPEDDAYSFIGPVGRDDQTNFRFFAEFVLASEFSGKPLIIKVDCS